VSANSEFEIGVTLVGARRLVGMVIELALPLGKVEFLGVQWARHGLLGEGVAPLVIHRPTGPDRIELAFSLPAVLEPDGIDGDGVLGRLRFRVRPQARGDIEIRVPRAVYRSARGATDDLAQDAVVLIAVVPGGDFDADGRVDFDDFLLLMDHLDATSPEAIQTFDLNGDGAVTLEDVFVLFAGMEPAAKALAEEKLPASSGLRAAFPNPFNAEVSLEFLLSRAQPIELVIYNALGQPVRHLGSGIRPPGVHRVVWDGRDDSGREATSGLYIAALRGTGLRSIRRLLLLR
jgi:hypothetical protein